MAAHPSLILNRHRALKLNKKLGKDVSTSPYKSKYMELKKRFFSDIFTVNFILPGVFFFGGGYFTLVISYLSTPSATSVVCIIFGCHIIYKRL